MAWTVAKRFYIYLKLCFIGAIKAVQEQTWDRQQPLNKDELVRGKEGDVIVVTGGGRGIGLEAVKTFITMGYHVIVGVRQPEKVKDTLESFVDSLKNGNYDMDMNKASSDYFTCLPLDLSNQQSVRDFASQVKDHCGQRRLRVLVNNAGIMFGPRKVTQDGLEMQLAVNYMSHFLLTHLLLPLLTENTEDGNAARVVNVSSAAHAVGLDCLDLDDVKCEKFYSAEGAYGISKLCQILSSNFLQDKFARNEEDIGSKVNFVSLHPGVVYTDLYQHARWVQILTGFMMKSVQQGGDTVVHAALDKGLERIEGDVYLENCHLSKASEGTKCLETQLKLFDVSCKMLNINEFGRP